MATTSPSCACVTAPARKHNSSQAPCPKRLFSTPPTATCTLQGCTAGHGSYQPEKASRCRPYNQPQALLLKAGLVLSCQETSQAGTLSAQLLGAACRHAHRRRCFATGSKLHTVRELTRPCVSAAAPTQVPCPISSAHVPSASCCHVACFCCPTPSLVVRISTNS